MIEREFKRQGMNLTEEEYPEFFRSVSVKKQYNTLDDFYAAVGYGGIQLWKIMPRLREEYQKTYASDLESITVPPVPEKRSKASSGVIIEGNDDVLVKFSNCCNPLPGDEIIGYITRGYGVSIHKRTCTNVPRALGKLLLGGAGRRGVPQYITDHSYRSLGSARGRDGQAVHNAHQHSHPQFPRGQEQQGGCHSDNRRYGTKPPSRRNIQAFGY